MNKCQISGRPPRRRDLSFRHATEADLDSIQYTISLSRWGCTPDLVPRERRVLMLFCALHRSGSYGYAGITAYQAAIARAVARCTEQPSSLRTIQRALAGLIEKGYLTQGRLYTRPRRVGPDAFTRDQVRTYTLTDRAAAIWGPRPWDRSERKQAQRPAQLAKTGTEDPSCLFPITQKETNKAVVAHLLTYDKVTEIRSEDSVCLHTLDHCATSDPDRVVDCKAAERCPDKAEPPATAGGKSTCPALQTDTPGGEQKASKASLRSETLQGKKQSEETSAHSPTPRALLRSIPHFSRKKTAAAIIDAIRDRVSRRGRIGRLIVAKAVMQLADPGLKTSINWNYWIGRWASLTDTERRYYLKTEIVPMLDTWSAAPEDIRGRPPASGSTRSPRPEPAALISPEALDREIAKLSSKLGMSPGFFHALGNQIEKRGKK